MAITVVPKPASDKAVHTLVNVPKAKNWSFFPPDTADSVYLHVRESDKGPVYGVFRMEEVCGWFDPDSK